MKELIIQTKIQIYSIAELSSDYQKLISNAKEQTQKAYAPYSSFQVGSAVLLANGEIVGGNNQENIAYPSGLCAERVALFYANSQYPNIAVKAIAIAAFSEKSYLKKPISPCGACRQVMIETENCFKENMEVLLYGEDEVIVVKKASDLLPLNFEM